MEDQQNAENVEEQQAEEVQATENQEAEGEQLVVSLGEEPAQEQETPAPSWVKDLRKQHREAQKRIRELEAEREQLAKPAETLKEPTLEDCDYDADKFKAELLDYAEKSRAIKQKKSEQENEQKRQMEEYQSKLENYSEKRKTINLPDFEDAEEVAISTFSELQQSMILQAADDPALLVYALGKNPAKAKELAAIKDPVKFAMQLGKVEATMKVEKKSPPPPMGGLPSGKTSAVPSEKKLAELKQKASESGNWQQYFDYKRSVK